MQQNEIDIEIGLEPDFSDVFFTTWTSPSNNSNFAVPVDYMVNDGDWHIYSFDWVTDAEVPYVDYYIDGVKVHTITTNVPTTNATLTLGVWVPSWAGGGVTDSVYNVSPGSRMWESDYAQFIWWRYIPFEMGGWEQRPVTNKNYDADYVVEKLDKVPEVNKTGRYKTLNATALFRYTHYLGYSTASRSNGSTSIEIGNATEWTDFSFEFTVDKADTQSIRYYLEALNSTGTVWYDDIVMTYLGHN